MCAGCRPNLAEQQEKLIIFNLQWDLFSEDVWFQKVNDPGKLLSPKNIDTYAVPHLFDLVCDALAEAQHIAEISFGQVLHACLSKVHFWTSCQRGGITEAACHDSVDELAGSWSQVAVIIAGYAMESLLVEIVTEEGFTYGRSKVPLTFDTRFITACFGRALSLRQERKDVLKLVGEHNEATARATAVSSRQPTPSGGVC